jgi:hypothetical protein
MGTWLGQCLDFVGPAGKSYMSAMHCCQELIQLCLFELEPGLEVSIIM